MKETFVQNAPLFSSLSPDEQALIARAGLRDFRLKINVRAFIISKDDFVGRREFFDFNFGELTVASPPGRPST